MQEAKKCAIGALRDYVGAEEHNAEDWSIASLGVAELAAEDATEVDALLVAARRKPGVTKAEVDEIKRIVREARKVAAKAKKAAKAGEVVGMDGKPREGQQSFGTIDGALRHIGWDGEAPMMRVPPPYRLGANGDNVRLMVDKGEDGQELLVQIAPSAVFVVGKSVIRGRHGDTEATFLTLAWQRDGRTCSATVPSQVLADRTKFGRLRSLDVPIPVRNAVSVAEWLSTCEEIGHAEGAIVARTAVRGMGWVSHDPRDGFFHGVDLVGGTDAVQVPPSVSARKVYEAHAPGGTWEGWLERVWRPLTDHPRVMFGLLAGCAAALVGPLGADPFIFEYGARTSKGKSKALNVIKSVWGKPTGTGEIGIKWGSTHVGSMRRGADQQGIPLVIDDTKEILTQPGGADELSKRAYAFVNAGGRMKADKDDPHAWEVDEAPRTLVVTAGESPIADLLRNHPGAIARIVTVRAPPWELSGEEGAAFADRISDDAGEHYGHAGRRLAEWLTTRSPEGWGKLRAKFKEMKRHYQRETAVSGAAQRGAAHLALIHVSGLCAAAAWGVEFPESAMAEGVIAMQEQVGAADVPAQAYETLWAYLAMNPQRIEGQGDSQHVPSNGYIGRTLNGPAHYAVPLDNVDKLLRERGYDPNDCTSEWIAQGWAKKQSQRIAAAGKTVKCYVLIKAGGGD